MKTLTFVVPCYNSKNYMHRCIDSLLPGGSDVEVLIINDGSTDGTAEIAEQYQKNCSGIVRLINQTNKGHGGAVNTGIKEASGKYIKIVDSDDWVDAKAYGEILKTLKDLSQKNIYVDMFISNYVYEKKDKLHKKVIKYDSVLPQKQVFTWDMVGKFHLGQYILMHSVIYRTQVLHGCGMRLPEHTFYVDNLYVYEPLLDVKKMYYLDVDFYRYYIGRQDQSVNENIMIKRIDQQINVNMLMVKRVKLEKVENKKLRDYMYSYIEIITAISSILLIRSGDPCGIEKMHKLWYSIKEEDPFLYMRLRKGLVGRLLHFRSKFGRAITKLTYSVARHIVGFN